MPFSFGDDVITPEEKPTVEDASAAAAIVNQPLPSSPLPPLSTTCRSRQATSTSFSFQDTIHDNQLEDAATAIVQLSLTDSIDYLAATSTPTSLSRSNPQSDGSSPTKRARPLLLVLVPEMQYNISAILDHLLIGGDEISRNIALLQKLNVKGIVNATKDGNSCANGKELCYVKLGWRDEADQQILEDLDKAFDVINEARRRGGCCLVHCKKGMSRSGSVVLAYLIKTKKMTLVEALAFSRSKRPHISPNPGFMSQLIEFERSQLGQISIDVGKYEENRFGETSAFVYAA